MEKGVKHGLKHEYVSRVMSKKSKTGPPPRRILFIIFKRKSLLLKARPKLESQGTSHRVELQLKHAKNGLTKLKVYFFVIIFHYSVKLGPLPTSE